MNIQRLLIALTVANFGPLLFLLAQARPMEAQGVDGVLRGRKLEIVDDKGRVRASIQVLPPDPRVWPNGKTYPETVILRLIDANGRPEVKIAASEQGAGLGFVGATDTTQAILQADGTESSVKLANKDGRQQLFKP